VSYHIRMLDRGNPELKPIEKESKNKDKIYFCVGCGSVATQTALFKIEGAVIVERYCDVCASKLSQSANQKLSLMPSNTFGNYIIFDKI
jgi:hypothetical protein